MRQHEQEKHDPGRVPLGAFIDRDQRQELTEIAQRDDRSVSIVRLALSDYPGREHEGDS
jgi:hypothetical protein